MGAVIAVGDAVGLGEGVGVSVGVIVCARVVADIHAVEIARAVPTSTTRVDRFISRAVLPIHTGDSGHPLPCR